MPIPGLGTWFASLILYGGLIFILIFLSTRVVLGSFKRAFILWGVIIGAFLLFAGGGTLWHKITTGLEEKKQKEQLQAFLEKSTPYFKEKCKKAGIFIYDKNIPSQDSVYIMKPMKTDTFLPYENRQYIKHDFFNHRVNAHRYSSSIDESIDRVDASFLKNYPFSQQGYYFSTHGFDYTELTDDELNLLRVSYIPEPVPYDPKIKRLIKEPIDRVTSRYGITWEDISTKEDRDHWVAGGKRQIIDLHTNQVVAEVIGYVMSTNPDKAYGWSWRNIDICPERYSPTDFLYSVLKNKEYLDYKANQENTNE